MTSLANEVYMLLLTAGRAGMTLEDVAQELELEPARARSVLRGLMRSRRIVKVRDRYVVSSAIRATPAPGKLCKVEVERVYKGFAVVKVNDRFMARLESTNYYGPAGLIKRGSAFIAKATITRIGDKTNVIVHDVVQKLD